MKHGIAKISGLDYLHRLRQHKRYALIRDIALFAAILAMGVLCALVILEPWNRPAEPLKKVLVGKLAISPEDPRSAELMKLARKRMQGRVLLKSGDFHHSTTWAALGANIDLAGIEKLVASFGVSDSPAVRYNREETWHSGQARIAMPMSLDSSAAVESLVALKETLDRKPVNARFNFKKSRVDNEVVGRSLDVYESLRRLDNALRTGATEVALSVVSVEPEVTIKELAGIKADVVAGFFETPYSRMIKDKDRTHNVTLAASKLDGEIILPGEVLSFNRVVGDRSEARGFRYAPVIAGGAIVEGMGGGACQVASTLHSAAFFAGLIIEERQPHSRPSSYIKLGLDATVNYPALDLKIRNPLEYPVVIHFFVENDQARAEIHAKERPFTITLLRKIIGTTPYPKRVVDNPALPKGKEVITQLGVPGFLVQRYKLIERDKIAYRFSSVDKYPPTTEFTQRGTGDPAEIKRNNLQAPRPDPHKPYKASLSLRMVQGLDLWYEQSRD